MGDWELFKMIFKSIGLAIVIIFAFLFVLGNILNGKDAPIVIIAYIIIDKIDKNFNK